MDCPPWLIWVLAGVVMLLGGQRAEAYPATQLPAGYVYAGTNTGLLYSTPEEAGQNSVGVIPSGCTGFSIYRKVYVGVRPKSGASDGTYELIFKYGYCGNSTTFPDDSYFTLSHSVAPASYTCPGGGTLNVQQCVCPAGDLDNGTACVTVQQQLCDTLNGQKGWVSQTGRLSPGQQVCAEAGCYATMASTLLYVTPKGTTTTTTEGEATYTNQTCSYTPATGAQNDSCPSGSSGSLNGQPYCAPYDPDTNVIQSVKSTSETTTQTETINGTPSGTSTGTTTTATDTKCEGATCTTTETKTTTTSDGTTTATTNQTVEGFSEFCKKNPGNALCQIADKGSFSGSCAGGFQCTGDAAMCAAARASQESKCLMDPGADVLAVAKQITDGTWAVAADLPSSTHDIGEFDQTNPFSASCPADQLVTLASHSVAIPLSSVCGELQMMGNALVAFTLLAATIFVLKGLGGT